jgi:predicted DNA-binding antitoxin AbrB/MazE fold protein
MTTIIEAIFDGSVFRPSTPVDLSPSTPVRLTIEAPQSETTPSESFLQTARDLKIQGPPDWASRL